MRMKLQKGGAAEVLLVILGIAIVVFILLGKSGIQGTSTVPSFFGQGGGNYGDTNNNSNNNTDTSVSAGISAPAKTSAYKNKIRLGSGNASYATQPFQEYITVENDGDTSINVTGWQLSNAKGSRTYSVGSNQQTFASDIATIPRGTAIISAAPSAPTDIILKPGESVAIVTGSAGNSYPYKIASFKESECVGYLTQQNMYNYSFSPYLQKSCIVPRNEPSANGLDLTCQNYIQNMQSCHTPKYNTIDSQGNTCNNCVDGNSSLSNACVSYIQAHFSYESCLVNHQNDSSFYGNVWHVYLNHAFELWAANHEVITLYDSSGKVVDYISY